MRRPGWFIVVALVATFCGATAQAANSLLYSWEGSLEGWTAANATLVNATGFGNTDGAQSMLLDNLTSGFKNDAGVATVGSGSQYLAWGEAGTRIAAGDTDVKLEFDLTFDNGSATAAFAQIALFVNSTGVGFKQYGTGGFIGGNIGSSFPSLDPAAVTDGVTMTGAGNTRHLAIPLGPTKSLNIGAPSGGSFYQIGFKANGSWGGTVDWAIDNMYLSGANIGIPEPTSIALVALGMSAMLMGRRRSA
jgi:hypothetical protein